MEAEWWKSGAVLYGSDQLGRPRQREAVDLNRQVLHAPAHGKDPLRPVPPMRQLQRDPHLFPERDRDIDVPAGATCNAAGLPFWSEGFSGFSSNDK